MISFLLLFREIEACNDLLASLCSGFGEALKVKAMCELGKLLPDGEHKAIGLFNMSAEVNQHSFYGRCIGFHVSFDTLTESKKSILCDEI